MIRHSLRTLYLDAGLAALRRRDPRSALGWLLLALQTPADAWLPEVVPASEVRA